MRWQVAYTSTMEGLEGPRVVEFDSWADAVRSAVNLAALGIAAERPTVRRLHGWSTVDPEQWRAS